VCGADEGIACARLNHPKGGLSCCTFDPLVPPSCPRGTCHRRGTFRLRPKQSTLCNGLGQRERASAQRRQPGDRHHLRARLVRAPAGDPVAAGIRGSYGALISSLPVGSNYVFTVNATDTNNDVYQGSATNIAIVQNQVTTVVITAQLVNPPPTSSTRSRSSIR